MSDHVAPALPRSGEGGTLQGSWQSRLTMLWDAMSEGRTLGPVRYSPLVTATLTSFVVATVILGAVLVRAPSDTPTLVLGSVTVLLTAVFAVRSILPVQTNWSTTAFMHLGLVFALGPVGVAASAVADAVGLMIRTRNGLFRTAFNASNFFLSGIAAYEVFIHVDVLLGGSTASEAVAGLVAGGVYFFANYGLLAVMIRAADPRVRAWAVFRDGLSVLPYNVGYGWSAFAFVVVHEHAGVIGFSALVMPVMMLQGALVVFTRRVRAYEEQRTAHQREREALLHKAVEASETERRRIARDLHDGVVQNLSGMAFAMSAASTRLRQSERVSGATAELLELMDHSADETRQAMKDLRTLIIEIAPPTLRREGLHAALLEVLRTLEQAGTKTRLELPSNMRLREDRASLIFRVAQEVLRNVAAHAEAGNVSVVLREVDGRAVLRIEDDGKGFTADDVARRRAEGHVGTNAIVELAEEAGGSLDIQSAPGKGTRIRLELPVEA
jgi:signal transduction histidine kinase